VGTGSNGGAGPSPRSSPRPPPSIFPASCTSQPSHEASNREEFPAAIGSAINSTAVSAPEGSASVQSNLSRDSVGCRSSGAAGCSDSRAASPPSPAPQNSPAPALRLKFTEMRDEMKRRRSAGVGAAPTGTSSAVGGSAVELAGASTLPADLSAPRFCEERQRVTRSASPTLPRTFDGGMRHMPAVANALRQVQHVVAQQEQVRRQVADQTQTRAQARGQPITPSSIPAEPSVAPGHRRAHSPIPTDMQRGSQRGPSLGHPGGSVAAAARASAGAAFNQQATPAVVGDLDATICGALTTSLGSALGTDLQRVPPINGLTQMRQEPLPPAAASEGSWAPPLPVAVNRCPDRGLHIEVENESSCVETSGGSPNSRRSSVVSCCSRPAADPLSSSGKFAPLTWSNGSSASVPGRRSPALLQPSAQQQQQRQQQQHQQQQQQQQQAEVMPLGSGAAAAPPALITGQSPHCSPRQADEERDPLHQAVQQFCRNRAIGIPSLVRQSPGVYTCSGRKLVLLLRNGRLMVRIGNSAVTLTEAVLQAASTGVGINPTTATPASAIAVAAASAAAAGPSPPPSTSTSSLGASGCIAPPPQLQPAKTGSSRPLAGAAFIAGHSTSHGVYGRVSSRLASPTVSCSVSPVSTTVGVPLGRGLSFGQ